VHQWAYHKTQPVTRAPRAHSTCQQSSLQLRDFEQHIDDGLIMNSTSHSIDVTGSMQMHVDRGPQAYQTAVKKHAFYHGLHGLIMTTQFNRVHQRAYQLACKQMYNLLHGLHRFAMGLQFCLIKQGDHSMQCYTGSTRLPKTCMLHGLHGLIMIMQFNRVHQRAYQADVQSVTRAPRARNGLAIQPLTTM